MKKRHSTAWIGFFIILIVILVAGGWLLFRLIPSTAEQISSNQKSILQVSITTPSDRAKIPLGQKVGILAHVASAALPVNIELFIDGEKYIDLAGQTSLEQKSTSFAWTWTPSQLGMVRLSAKVVDSEGRTAWSNSIRLFITASAGIENTSDEEIQAQNTVAYSSELMRLLQSPDSHNDDSLDARIESLPSSPLTIKTPAQSLFEPQPQTTSDALNGLKVLSPARYLRFSLWLQNLTSKAPPEAPQLTGINQGCNTALILEDRSLDEAGFRLFRLGPYDADFLLVAEFDAQSGIGRAVYFDKGLPPGKYQYYASAVNGSAEVAGNLLPLEIDDPACQSSTPLVSTYNPLTIKPKQEVDKLYCYISLDVNRWQRVPSSLSVFINPVNGVFDLAPHLKSMARSTRNNDLLELECWGWSGNALINLGKVSFNSRDTDIQTIDGDFLLSVQLRDIPVRQDFDLQSVNSIAPPYQLHYPKDLQDCLAHESSLACAIFEENPYGLALLAWNWRPEGDCEVEQNCGYNIGAIDGFHVYQVQPILGEPMLIKTVPAHERLALIEPPTIGVALLHPQYFVRAFRGIEESADSNLLTSNKGSYSVTIPATKFSYTLLRIFKYRMPYSEKWIGPMAMISDFNQPGESLENYDALVGYTSFGKKAVGWDGAQWFKYSSMFYDKFLAFDLSNIQGNITSARLQWSGVLYHAGDGSNLAEPAHCKNYIDANTDALVNSDPISLNGDLDVTVWARAWLDGLTVYGFGAELPHGFWFRSGIRHLPFVDDIAIWGSDMDACYMDINQAHLFVEYEGQ